VLRSGRQVEPVARGELHVAVHELERDRSVEAEQHLVVVVRVRAVAVSGSVPPRARRGTALGPEDRLGIGAFADGAGDACRHASFP
jgi:hypothetical protein